MPRGKQVRVVDMEAVRASLPDMSNIALLREAATPPPLPKAASHAPLPLATLWFEHQPRELIPEEQLQRLIADGQAQPAPVLDILRRLAETDRYYCQILTDLEGLARSIRSQGVYQPIEVVHKQGRYIVRDGHRRSLACLLAELSEVPAVEIQEPTELSAVARPFIVNLQRSELTAVEKGAALLRLALLVARHLANEQGIDTSAVTIEALVGDGSGLHDSPAGENPGADAAAEDPGGAGEAPNDALVIPEDSPAGEKPAPALRRGAGLPYGLAGKVRARVCAMTGLSDKRYYDYLALNRLAPDARGQARSLSEYRLRPLVAVSPARQAELLAVAARHDLDDKAFRSLCQVYRRNDEDEIQRVLARLRRDQATSGRTSVSWESLLTAIPEDYGLRGEALEAELKALPPKLRTRRVAQMLQQLPRLAAVHDLFERLIDRHGAESEQADDPRYKRAKPPG